MPQYKTVYEGLLGSEATSIILANYGKQSRIQIEQAQGLTIQGRTAYVFAANPQDLETAIDHWESDDIDAINLERGGTYTTDLRLVRSTLTIDAFGTGNKPQWIGRHPVRTVNGIGPIYDITIRNIDFSSDPGWNGIGKDCVGFRWLGRGGNILLEDCSWNRFANNIVIEGNVPKGVKNIRINRCQSINPFSTTDGVTSFHTSNHTGLTITNSRFVSSMLNTEKGSLVSHHLYISNSEKDPGQKDKVTGNLFYNARTNITMRGGGQCRNNVSIRAGQHIAMDCPTGTLGSVSSNHLTETRDHWNGQSVGWGIWLRGTGEIIGNVVIHATDGTGEHIGLLAEGTQVAVADNLVLGWRGNNEGMMSPALMINTSTVSYVYNNSLYQLGPQAVVWVRGAMPLFANNAAYTENTWAVRVGQTEFLPPPIQGFDFITVTHLVNVYNVSPPDPFNVSAYAVGNIEADIESYRTVIEENVWK